MRREKKEKERKREVGRKYEGSGLAIEMEMGILRESVNNGPSSRYGCLLNEKAGRQRAAHGRGRGGTNIELSAMVRSTRGIPTRTSCPARRH